ncbi:DUF4218 domain-containing protein, partial [Aphis craccivora]
MNLLVIKQISAIIELPIYIPKVVVIDYIYMHCVCFGVMKRLLEFWTTDKKSIRISESNKNIIINKLLNLRTSVTSEFAMLPRTLNDLEYWKATEYREFLLYTGIIEPNKRIFIPNNFLLLFISFRILSSEICFSQNMIANELILKFVNKFISKSFITYIYLVPLNMRITFNKSKFMKWGRYPLSEVHNRLSDLLHTYPQHQYLVLENGDIVAIQSIYKNFNDDIIQITVLKVLNVQNVFINPLSSNVV